MTKKKENKKIKNTGVFYDDEGDDDDYFFEV
jgi:hypothetical protein